MAVGIRRSDRGVDLDFDFRRITDNVKDAFFYKIEVIVGEDLALYLGIAGENRLFGKSASGKNTKARRTSAKADNSRAYARSA